MSRPATRRTHPALPLGILLGFTLSVACMADQMTIWAKDVLFEKPISGLDKKNVQLAIGALLAGWLKRPLDKKALDKEAVAALGKRSDDNPLAHLRYTDAEARVAAVGAWGPASTTTGLHHPRYGADDIAASRSLLALRKAIQSAAAEAAALRALTGSACPPGYAQSGTGTTPPVVCKRGKDEMVRVGDFWIDRYEMTIVNSKYYNGGKCDDPQKAGKRYGYLGPLIQDHDDYGSAFPSSGAWTTPLAACSIPGLQPSRSMSWFHAAQACAAAGKRVCTDLEWQVAAAGTPDDKNSCTTSSPSSTLTGLKTKCISAWGAYDMTGNLWELDGWWNIAGQRWLTASGAEAQPWPGDFGDGKDTTWNVNATVLGSIKGRPTVVLRSGSWINNVVAGQFAIDFKIGPVTESELIGARCCI